MFLLGVHDDRQTPIACSHGRQEGLSLWGTCDSEAGKKEPTKATVTPWPGAHTLGVCGLGRGWAGNSCSRKVPWKLSHYSLMKNALSDVE